MSKGEDRIVDILNRENVSYTREKTFKDLKHGLFRYDFYLPNYHGRKIAIEFNGAQHYVYVSRFYKKKSDMQKAQEHDRQKISYCLANNIEIYEVPYWDLNYLNSVNDLLKNEYHAKSRWHNDLIWEKKSRG